MDKKIRVKCLKRLKIISFNIILIINNYKSSLKANKLAFQDIISMLGFKQSSDYMEQFRRIVTSKYSYGVFLQTESIDGQVYNITVGKEKIVDYTKRLNDAYKMFKLRLQWLTSGSRRVFGVVTEQSIW